MNALQRFEQRLESVISGVFARAFRSAVQPVEIAAALQRECDNNAQVLSRQRRLVPNDFHVELSATDLERMLGLGRALEQDLVDQLQDHADAQGYVFTGPISVAFEERRRPDHRALPDPQQGAGQRHRQRPAHPLRGASHATLEVNGTRHPLRPPGLVVGRGTEADLRINDPGVSRRHLELEVTIDGVEAVDLGSTNGILVDGSKVGRARLRDGVHDQDRAHRDDRPHRRRARRGRGLECLS